MLLRNPYCRFKWRCCCLHPPPRPLRTSSWPPSSHFANISKLKRDFKNALVVFQLPICVTASLSLRFPPSIFFCSQNETLLFCFYRCILGNLGFGQSRWIRWKWPRFKGRYRPTNKGNRKCEASMHRQSSKTLSQCHHLSRWTLRGVVQDDLPPGAVLQPRQPGSSVRWSLHGRYRKSVPKNLRNLLRRPKLCMPKW